MKKDINSRKAWFTMLAIAATGYACMALGFSSAATMDAAIMGDNIVLKSSYSSQNKFIVGELLQGDMSSITQ